MSEPVIVCAFCNAEGIPAAAEDVTLICAACGGTVVRVRPLYADTRPATMADVDALTPIMVTRLRKARAAIARPGRRAVG